MSLPQDQWPPFVPPTCDDCGHQLSQHGRATAGLHISHGPCFVEGCGCRKYTDAHTKRLEQTRNERDAA